MTTKKKTSKKKNPPLFEKMKPKKGFASFQIVVAVAPNGILGTHVVDDESPECCAAEARENIIDGRSNYEKTQAMRGAATLHLVEVYVPIPKPQVVKKAKARTKKIAGPKPPAAKDAAE